MKSSRGPSKAGKAGPAKPAAKRAPVPPRSPAPRPAVPAARRPAPAPRSRGSSPTDAFTLFQAFDRGDFPATLYVDGPDESLKAALLADLRHAWAREVPEAAAARVLRAAESDVADILAVYHGGSLFSPRELAIVLDVEDLGRSEKKIAALAEGLIRPSGGACLVLLEGAADGDRKVLTPLRLACTRRWTAESPSREELLRWGARRLGRDGVRAEPGVVEAVSDQCEDDASALFNELDKLATFAGPDGRLTHEEVRRLRRPALDADLPEYLAAVALGDVAGASRRLGRLLATGAGEGEILWALSNLVGGALGGWKKFPQPSFALARRCSARDLGRALDALYRAEAAWKRGLGDVTVLLEHATRQVAAGDWSTSSSGSRSSRT